MTVEGPRQAGRHELARYGVHRVGLGGLLHGRLDVGQRFQPHEGHPVTTKSHQRGGHPAHQLQDGHTE